MNFKNQYLANDINAYFIAEIGINHNGQLELAKRMIKKSKEAGARAVKFQKRDIGFLTDPDLRMEEPTGYLSIDENDIPNEDKAFGTWTYPDKRLEFTDDEYGELINFAKKYEIDFIISPWEEKSVDFIENNELKVIKLASIDTVNFQFCEYIARKKIPTIASVGMCNFEQITQCYDIFKKNECPLMFMHCTSSYPCPIEDKNLNVIKVLKNLYDTEIGFSGHGIGIEGTVGAISLDSRVIEKHVTLSRKMSGPDQAASLEFDELKELIKISNNVIKAMGSPFKKLEKSEIPLKDILTKRFIAIKDINEDEKISSDSVRTVVTNNNDGITPEKYYSLLNCTAIKEIKKNQIITEELVSKL